MSWRNGHSRNDGSRPPFREAAGLNYAIVSGTLTAAPRRSRGHRGEAVVLLAIVIPVLNPERPQEVWSWSGWDIEVPSPLAARRGAEDLEEGHVVLAAGQISERPGAGNGLRRNVLLAELLHREPPPDPPGLYVVGGSDRGPSASPGNGEAAPGRSRACEGRMGARRRR